MAGLVQEIEKKFGLPPLSRVADVMDKFPDAKQLHLIKGVLEAADAISKNAPELDKVASLIREINAMPMEKLIKLEKVLKRIEKIMKTAPQDLMGFIMSLKE